VILKEGINFYFDKEIYREMLLVS